MKIRIVNFLKMIFHKKRDWTYDITKRLLEEKRDTGKISDESYHKAADEALNHIFSGQPPSKKEIAKQKQKEISDFKKKDFTKYLHIDKKAIQEIIEFFIIQNGTNSFNREFWIVDGKQTDWLAKILSVYSFSIYKSNITPLIEKVNAFLLEMKKDVPFWKDYEHYKLDNFDESYLLFINTDLGMKLQSLSIGERMYFFDSADMCQFNSYWGGLSSAKTRTFNINEKKALDKMISLGLFDPSNEIEAIPYVTGKGELKDRAEIAGFELKKSWDLNKTFNYLMATEKGKKFLAEYMHYRTALLFKENYKDDLGLIFKHYKKMKRFVDLLAMV